MTPPTPPFESGPYQGPTDGHWIQSVGGGVVTLEDGSRWEIHATTRSEVIAWRPEDVISLRTNQNAPDGYGYLLQNVTRRSQAVARLVSQPPR